jgi:SAM-dependent methyltransferase
MSDMSFEQLAYELPEIWDEEWFPPEDHERVRALAKLIPDANGTLLDIGCGNGLFLNYLNAEYGHRFGTLVGIDRSEAALAHVQTDKQLANIDCIPIDDLQFDTVTCMEVLEHLPVATFSKALAEIARIARRTIIISVPYKEDLKASRCECPTCFTSFHPDYHMRTFDEYKLKTLFPARSFEITGTHYLGPQVRRYDYELRTRVRRLLNRTSPAFPSYAMCPVCGFLDKNRLSDDLATRKRGRVVTRVLTAEETRRSRIGHLLRSALTMPPRYRWIAAAYKRIGLGR